jgi:SH3-like domain-containing protein
MSRPVLLAAIAAASILPAGCSRDRPTMPPPAPPAPAERAIGDRYVTAAAPLRREPADAAKVKGEGGKAQVPNQLALLLRGERVTFLEPRGDWSRVRASDGTEGWVRSQLLLPADGVVEGTVLAQAWAFDRPDLLAVNVKRKVEPGTLLLVVKTRELFSEVDAGQGPNAWVLSDRVTTQPEDVMAAKLVEKARWLARTGRGDEARDVLGVLRARLPASPLIQPLAVELGEAPPADAGAAGTFPAGADGGPGPMGAGSPPAPVPPPPGR